MIIKLTGKNIDISDALREQTHKKVGKLERYFSPDTEAQVTMSIENYRHIVEVTIPFNGVVIRAEEETDSLYTSIDKVLDKLEEVLGIQAGHTTPDGLFTLNATRCLGACGLAPVMMINEDVYGRLTPDEIPGIIAKYRS